MKAGHSLTCSETLTVEPGLGGTEVAVLPGDEVRVREGGPARSGDATAHGALSAAEGVSEPCPRPAAARRGRRRVLRWLTRPRRIFLLLIAIWVLSAFDLRFTLQEAKSHYFIEMNPIAARLMRSPAQALTTYKLLLLVTGTAILMLLRRHAVAELACWFLLASCFYVAVRWYAYYEGLWGFESQVFHPPW